MTMTKVHTVGPEGSSISISKDSAISITTPEELKGAVELRIKNMKDLSPYLTQMLFDEPWFAGIMRIVNVEFSELVPTAGVMVKNGDIHMLINAGFVSALTNAQIRGLLKHECYHLAFNHCTSRRHDPHAISNIAQDLAINSDIPEIELPEGGMIPGTCSDEFAKTPLGALIRTFPKHKSSEWYFVKIMENNAARLQGLGFQGMDFHDLWDTLSAEDKALIKGKVQKAVADATASSDRRGQWGTVSSEMRNRIRELTSRLVDWKGVMKNFCGFSRRGTRATTWSHLNTTMIHPDFGPLATGAKRGYTSSVAIYIDQSGSVCERALSLIYGELQGLARRTEFTVYHFDTSVDTENSFTWKRGQSHPAMRTRCGGTDFECVTKHANANKAKFDGCILITDGEAGKPSSSPMKRLWMIVPDRKLMFEKDSRDAIAQMRWPKTQVNAA